jgi:hypothetical protein
LRGFKLRNMIDRRDATTLFPKDSRRRDTFLCFSG